MDKEKPKLVTICGSSKFIEHVAICAWLIERDEGAITMSMHLLPGWYGPDLKKHHQAESERVAVLLDCLHLAKIGMSDEIFVVNYGDYIGDSTSNEIAEATKLGLPIRYYTTDPVGARCKRMWFARDDG